MVKAKSAKEFFRFEERVADLGLIAAPGAEELTEKINCHLLRWAKEAGMDVETFIIPSECPRFQSGDGKALIKGSVRGDDLFIVIDVGNYSCRYKLFGHENYMSPDDHFQNLKRLIQAASGKAHRVSIIVRRPPAPAQCPGEPGLRLCPAGAAGHGCVQHHHL